MRFGSEVAERGEHSGVTERLPRDATRNSANATILIGKNSQLGDSNSLSDGDGKGTLSGTLSGVSYKTRAEFYKQRMIKYLKEYSTLYPEYLNPGSGIDAIHPENDAYTTSIWLGDFDCCAGKSFEELYQGDKGCSSC